MGSVRGVPAIYLHGVRGSVPVSDTRLARHGGDTTCIEIDLGQPGRRLVIDCGTGMRRIRVPDAGTETTFDMLFSHFHWDHIEGLAFFPPLFAPQHRFTFHGRADGMSVREALESVLRPPWFPVSLAEMASRREYVDLGGGPFSVGDAEVRPIALHHPQGATGYRISAGGRTVVIATDHESGRSEVDRNLVELATGADLLLHDAQYTADDYTEHRGWGHSTWERAVDTAIAARVGQLVTISHAPSRTDDELDRLVQQARTRFPNTTAGRAGSTIEF